MINFIIFSYNRSCQLDLLLRSIKEFFIGWERQDINILYKYSSEHFKLGYEKIKRMHPEFNYILESNFKNDTVKLINQNNYYTLFGVDDDVFKEIFTLECLEIELLKSNKDVACLSMRMHPGIAYCYTENRATPPPNFLTKNPYTWEWYNKELLGDWSYPMSIDFTVFKTEDVLGLCRVLQYNNPNYLEGQLALRPIHKPYMICFEKSKIFNIPVNKVQTVNANRFGNISAEFLNDKFLEGYRICLKPLKGFNTVSAHQEVILTFEATL